MEKQNGRRNTSFFADLTTGTLVLRWTVPFAETAAESAMPKVFPCVFFDFLHRMTLNLTSPCFAPSAPDNMHNFGYFFFNWHEQLKSAAFPRNESLGANRSGLITLGNCIGCKQASVFDSLDALNVLEQLGTYP